MKVRVEPGSIEVLDHEVLTSLAVTTSLPLEDAVGALILNGLARARGDDLGHVWLDIGELARRAAPADDGTWRSAFSEMVTYAASRGWTASHDTIVRAHVEVDP